MSTEQKTNGGTSTAIVRGPAARMEMVKSELKRASPSLAAMLPKHVTLDRMIRIVTSAVSRTPDLMDCTPTSIVLATAQACAIGLEPNTALGLGYLIPFSNKKTGKRECQFIPGYKGLARLAVNSGEVQYIQARLVRERDMFTIDYGTDQSIVHRPYLGGDAGKLIGAYAVAEMKNGSKVFEFMSIEELNAIRVRSQSADSGPWVTDEGEMYKKTAVRRLCKSLPLSEEKLARALEHQAAAEAGSGPDFSDVIDVLPEQVVDEHGEVTTIEPASRTEALNGRLAAKAAS